MAIEKQSKILLVSAFDPISKTNRRNFGKENSQWNSDSDFLGFDSSSETQGSVREGMPREPLGDVQQLRLSIGDDGLSLPHSRRGGKRIKSKLRLL